MQQSATQAQTRISPRIRLFSFFCLLGMIGFQEMLAQEIGLGTYYADKYHGKPTASGELYNRNDFTAAHKTLPFGTRVKVTRLDNGRIVYVRINDRGPFTPGRVIDLSYIAAQQLDMIRTGETRVRVDIVESPAIIESPEVISTLPVAPASPPTRDNRDLSSLPLRDHNGNLISGGGNPRQPGTSSPGTPARPFNPIESAVDAQSGAVPGAATNPELSKYTPALFRMVALKKEAEGFGVQVGAYFSFYRLLEALDQLSQKNIQNTLVQSGVKNGQAVFRIIVGPYSNRADANRMRRTLSNQRYKGIVVNLAELK